MPRAPPTVNDTAMLCPFASRGSWHARRGLIQTRLDRRHASTHHGVGTVSWFRLRRPWPGTPETPAARRMRSPPVVGREFIINKLLVVPGGKATRDETSSSRPQCGPAPRHLSSALLPGKAVDEAISRHLGLPGNVPRSVPPRGRRLPRGRPQGPARPRPAIIGFSPRSLDKQRAAEAHALTIPTPENARRWLRILTAEPHVAGTPADHKTAIFVRDKLREWGWKADLVEFEVLLNYPVTRLRG